MQSAAYKKKTKQVANFGEELLPDDFEIFEGLSRAEIDRVVDAGVMRSVDGGKLLFRKGDTGKDMFLILKGRVQIVDEYDNHKKILAELGPGEFFGEMSVFEKVHVRSAHAIVKEPSQLLVLREDILNKLIDKKMPKRFLKNIIGVLCHRIRANNAMYMRFRYNDKSSKKVNWLG